MPLVQGSTTSFASTDLGYDVESPMHYSLDSLTIRMVLASDPAKELDFSDDVTHSILLELEFA